MLTAIQTTTAIGVFVGPQDNIVYPSAGVRTAIRTDPKSHVAYNNRGNEKAVLKDYEGAFRDFDEAIRLDPNFAVAYYNRG